MKIPDKIFGIDTTEAYEKVMKKLENKEIEEPKIIPAPLDAKDSANYILLPQTKDHPDLYIAKRRLSIKDLNQPSAQLQDNNQGYIGDIKWKQAIDLNTSLGNFTLPPVYFVEFLNLLRSGRAFDGKGSILSKATLDQVLNEILAVRDPYRAEWLDAKFGNNTIRHHKFDSNGKLTEVTEPLEECLMQDKTPGINLDYWLRNPTPQGLPRNDTPDGDLYYWHPQNNAVALFGAFSDRAGLNCYRDPQGSYLALGVRGAKIKV